MIFEESYYEEVTQVYAVRSEWPGLAKAREIINLIISIFEMIATTGELFWKMEYNFMLADLSTHDLPEADLIASDKQWELESKQQVIRYYLAGILARLKYQMSLYAEDALPEFEGAFSVYCNIEYNAFSKPKQMMSTLLTDETFSSDPWTERATEVETQEVLNNLKVANRELLFSLPIDSSEIEDCHFRRIQSFLRKVWKQWNHYRKVMVS